ncbi:MAG: hypothetical protein P1U89_18845 [Verrucomicrobiales bacterium]|nr:hypothetical protein [Verrucomicrobiales bacterium]
MNGLRTARALVLDDDPTEGILAVEALSKLGIGSYYYSGENPPDRPHHGMRLLVIDMVLEKLGATGDNPKNYLSILMGALERLIQPEHDSLIIICWTKHSEVVNQFSKAFETTFPNCRISKLIVIDEKMRLVDNDKLQELANSIESAFQDNGPNPILSIWEQTIHNATSEITQSFYEIENELKNSDSEAEENSFKIAAALAVAERGTRLRKEGEDEAVCAFSNSLVPLLADRIEHAESLNSETIELPLKEKLFVAVKAEIASRALAPDHASLLPQSIRSKLNTKINVSFKVSLGTVYPGNAYNYDENSTVTNSNFPKKAWDEVYGDTFYGNTHKDTPSKILIELSAACDFAQANSKFLRFCVGYIVPLSEYDEIKSSNHIRALGPFWMQTSNDTQTECLLVTNCHYVFGMDLKVGKKLTPLFRLRSNLLSDLVAWQASHSSRPGFIELGPRFINERTPDEKIENDDSKKGAHNEPEKGK